MLPVEISIGNKIFGSPNFQLSSDFFTLVISFLFIEICRSEHHLITFFPGVIIKKLYFSFFLSSLSSLFWDFYKLFAYQPFHEISTIDCQISMIDCQISSNCWRNFQQTHCHCERISTNRNHNGSRQYLKVFQYPTWLLTPRASYFQFELTNSHKVGFVLCFSCFLFPGGKLLVVSIVQGRLTRAIF